MTSIHFNFMTKMKPICIPLFLLCFLCSWMILPLEVSTSTKLLMPAMRVALSISSWWMFTLRRGYRRNPAWNCAFYSVPGDSSYCSGCIISGVLNSVTTVCRHLCHFWPGTRLCVVGQCARNLLSFSDFRVSCNRN